MPVIKKGEVITYDLNVRKKAEFSAESLGVIKVGSEVEIVEELSGWYKIKYENGYGYVYSIYVKDKTENTKPPVSEDTEETPEVDVDVNILYTDYDYTVSEMIKYQSQKSGGNYSEDYFKNFIDVNLKNVENYMLFLRVDEYREVDKDKLASLLSDKGVLSGQEDSIINSCRKYGLDPVYFISQSVHETAAGTSTLAKGVQITEIADESKPINDESGELIGYEMIKLDEPVTVYNLFGIGAKNNSEKFPNRALVLGTTRAYNEGWTSIESAIEGAAAFISSNYVNSGTYKQNTVYKLRFNPSKTYGWHEYATSPWYAKSIAEYMKQYKYVYKDGNTFTLDVPKYIPEVTVEPQQ